MIGLLRRVRGLNKSLIFNVYALLVIAVSGLLVAQSYGKHKLQHGAIAIAFWLIVSASTNLVQVEGRGFISVSSSQAPNIAIAFLFPPWVTALIVLMGSWTRWEVKRQTKLKFAIFNRSQLALSAATCSTILWLNGPPNASISSAATLVIGGLAYNINVLLVAAAQTIVGSSQRPLRQGLLPRSLVTSAVYLFQSGFGFVLARTYQEIGQLPVLFFIFPLLLTRRSLQISRDLEKAESARRLESDRVIGTRDAERSRIASELHEVVLQKLRVLNEDSHKVADLVTPDGTTRDLALTNAKTTEEVITDLREVVQGLRKVPLDEAGLIPTLERQSGTYETTMGLKFSLNASGIAGLNVSQETAELIFECYREAVSNVKKHAGATEVHIELLKRSGDIVMKVLDNGQWKVATGDSIHLGLDLTKDRVMQAGGSFKVGPVGNHTEAEVRLPLPVAPVTEEASDE